MRCPPRRLSRANRGFVAVLVMLLLCWIAALGGLRALVLANAAVVSRASDSARQEAVLIRRLERVVEESVLACEESGRTTSPVSADSVATAKLAELDAGGVKIELSEAPNRPAASPFPVGSAAAFASPSAGLLAAAGPNARAMLGARVAELAPQRWRFTMTRQVLGVARRSTVLFEERTVEVPLSRYPVLAYEFPSEAGSGVANQGTGAPVSDLPPGLARQRDSRQLTTLFVDGAVPYHYRRRASLAALCQYLCSQAFINRTAVLAGPALRHELGVPESETAKLDGLSRTGLEATFDLSRAGSGTWNGRLGSGGIVVVSAKVPGAVLTLTDSLQSDGLDPLLLLVVGEPGGGLLVNLGSVRRPVVLFAYNAVLQAPSGGEWNGTLFLDPGCSFSAASQAPLSVAHLAYAASSTTVSEMAVHTSVALAPALEAVLPRVRHVVARRIDS